LPLSSTRGRCRDRRSSWGRVLRPRKVLLPAPYLGGSSLGPLVGIELSVPRGHFFGGVLFWLRRPLRGRVFSLCHNVLLSCFNYCFVGGPSSVSAGVLLAPQWGFFPETFGPVPEEKVSSSRWGPEKPFWGAKFSLARLILRVFVRPGRLLWPPFRRCALGRVPPGKTLCLKIGALQQGVFMAESKEGVPKKRSSLDAPKFPAFGDWGLSTGLWGVLKCRACGRR